MKLNCKEIKIFINAYFDNELSNEDKKLIEQHLQSCQQCRNEAIALQKTILLIKNLDKIPAPAELEHQLNTVIEEKTNRSLIGSLLPSQLLNNIKFKMLQIASIITLSLIICFIFLLFLNKDVNYISHLSPQERYLNTPMPTIPNGNNEQIEQLINNEELATEPIQNKINNYLFQSPNVITNKTPKKPNLNSNKPSIPQKTATQISNDTIEKLQNQTSISESIKSAQKTSKELNYSITQLSRYSLKNNFVFENNKADIIVYAYAYETYNDKTPKNIKSQHPRKESYNDEAKYSDNTFKKAIKSVSRKDTPETILVPVNFIYNFNEPIMVMTRIYFAENKSIKKIEFLSNSLDSRMKVLLLKSLRNYNWKDYLIRYNLQGVSYEMDFILANEGMTLWNLEEKIL